MALELMSPAGSYDGVVAAVRGGADAVYFGAGDFNARRGARNLNDEELPEAIKYCRLRGVKTYITVNTLVTDRELSEARALVGRLNAWGADALIVQDLGMARMIRAVAPDMPIHASTQMTIHNLAGAMAAKKLGFSRVVLSRELPLSEIEFISRRAGIETEVFCHGALCMCYSGQCYFSAAVGGRSGNRGMCAQPCRMQYSFFGSSPGYHLSLKDLSLASYLGRMEAAGVTCVKIEGRMKRPEYTALVTNIYKRAITSGAPPTKDELDKLETVFSRSGFTDAYLTETKGPDMFGMRSEEDKQSSRAIYKEAAQIYESQPETPRIGVDMLFTARAGSPMTLCVRDLDGNEHITEALPAEAAVTQPSTASEIAVCLRKTGGTVFFPANMKVTVDPGLRVPASAVNAIRRSALESLSNLRRRPPQRGEGEWQPGVKRLPYDGGQKFIFSFLKLEQVTPDVLERRPDMIYLPLSEVARHADIISQIIKRGQPVVPVLPRIIWDRQWPQALGELRAAKEAGVTAIVCTNLGQLELLRPLGLELRCDYGLNVMNSQSIKELKSLGAASCTLSFELNMPQIRDISASIDSELIVYGRLPLMITENCVIKRRNGSCVCDGPPNAIIDKTGRSFPLVKEEYCRTAIYNSEKLYLADRPDDLRASGVRWLRLCFTTENNKECASVVADYMDGEPAAMPERMTRGLYYRGVQ